MPNYYKGEHPIVYDEESAGGVSFAVCLHATAEGGHVTAATGGLRVEGADAVTLILTAATSFNGVDRSPRRDGRDPTSCASADLAAAAARPYAALRAAHSA